MMLEPKVINAETAGRKYVKLLGGPPESILMRSGAVELRPGETVGKHSTECNEEFLVMLEGEGVFILGGNAQLEITEGQVVYCPPNTEHDVKNVGATPLKYIYIVAKTG
ncbi:MAG: cupin domain-containing protein [Anaerolineaceae bacterium]